MSYRNAVHIKGWTQAPFYTKPPLKETLLLRVLSGRLNVKCYTMYWLCWNTVWLCWNTVWLCWNAPCLCWNAACLCWNDACLCWNAACMGWNATCLCWNAACLGWNAACLGWNAPCLGWNVACLGWNSVNYVITYIFIIPYIICIAHIVINDIGRFDIVDVWILSRYLIKIGLYHRQIKKMTMIASWPGERKIVFINDCGILILRQFVSIRSIDVSVVLLHNYKQNKTNNIHKSKQREKKTSGNRFSLIICCLFYSYKELTHLYERKERFYLTRFSIHSIYGHMSWDHSIARGETGCRHYMGYIFRLEPRYISSHIHDSTYHRLCWNSWCALAGTRNSSIVPHLGL